LGGVQRCLELAEQTGLPVVGSSALESSVGLSAGLALAAALPELPHACGLGTAMLLNGDLVDRTLHASVGLLPVGRRDPAPGLLERASAGAELAARWAERLPASAAALCPPRAAAGGARTTLAGCTSEPSPPPRPRGSPPRAPRAPARSIS